MSTKTDKRKYLPSRQFTLIIGLVIIGLVVATIVLFIFSKNESFNSEKNSKNVLAVENPTVLDLIQKDTDLDSIPDWEEALWGTDKNKQKTFDIADAVYIENKKKELKIEQIAGDTKLTETDKFAREFFTAYVALKASGEVDQDTITNFSKALGDKLADSTLVDQYSLGDITISDNDSQEKKEIYYTSMQKLFDKYAKAGIGDELDIISTGINSYNQTGKESQYEELTQISKAYRDFAQGALLIPVPRSIANFHLKIINSANNTGISVQSLTQVLSDPIVGVTGLSQYEKYSEDLVNAVGDLESELTNEGTLSENNDIINE